MSDTIRKILLINPRKPLYDDDPEIFNMFRNNNEHLKLWFAPPLSLLTIAALTPQNFEIKIVDEHFEDINFNEEVDIIGLTAMTQQAYRAYEIADEFRKKGIPVVMGGIHSTILPDEALTHVDHVFIGEAEETWIQFLNDFKTGNAKRKYLSPGLTDLKKSITPRYELINFSKFVTITDYFKFLPVQATRGCPHDCSFCVTSEFYGKKIRKKDISQIIEEIKLLKELSNNSLLLFVDDNLFADHNFAKALLKQLIPLKIKYIAQSDVRVAEDEELLKLAYLSGCMMIFIGFESIDQQSLSSVNQNSWKSKQFKNYRTAIQRVQENGIVVFGAFVIGFENDNMETFVSVRDFVIENKIPGQFTILTPLPGTRIYEEMKQAGKLMNNVFWNKCNFFNMTFYHHEISPEQGKTGIVNLHNEVFSDKNAFDRFIHMKNIYRNLPERWKLY